MLVPFSSLPKPRRIWLTVAFLALALACSYVLAEMAPPQAQPCVLYGSRHMPERDWHLALIAMFTVSDSLDATWACLRQMAIGRELVLVLVDDLFAVSYGLGLGLLLAGLSGRAEDCAAMPRLLTSLLRFAAACYPLAAIFDLVENQVTAALLLLPRGVLADTLILAARYCAIPKYDLSLLAGPLVLAGAGVIALVSWCYRRTART